MRVVRVVRGGFVPSFKPDAFMYQRLGAVALDPNSAAVVAEVARQRSVYGHWINTADYTSSLVVAPPSQPLVPVKLTRPEWGGVVPGWAVALRDVFATGLPIPAGFVPNSGTDSEASFCQPGYVGPAGHTGRYFEAWVLRVNTGPDATAFPWTAAWGGRAVGLDRFPGHFFDWFTDSFPSAGYHASTPGDPHSTYQDHNWGTTATSLPFRDLEISVADVQRGVIEHALGFAAPLSDGFRWPAQRYDTGVAGSPVQQGMRFRLPAGHVPVCSHPVGRMIEVAARDFGLVEWDFAPLLSFRAEPGAVSGDPTVVLAGFPWGSLQVLKSGSDSNPNPTS